MPRLENDSPEERPDNEPDSVPDELAARPEDEHLPVLVEEVVTFLTEGKKDEDNIYLDLTVGLGGHLLAISQVIGPQASLIGFDRDPDAISTAARRLEGRRQQRQQVRLIHSSFANLAEYAGEPGLVAVTGIVLDLGLSSRQLNDAGRGFAFRMDGPLDMRFDPSDLNVLSAATLVADYSASQLADIFFHFGEERHSRKYARAIEQARAEQPIRTTRDLVAVLEPVIPYRDRNKTLARLFQALRIAVNRELEQIEQVLPVCLDLLKSGGRMAVITYHSLEDRLIKQFFREASGYGGGKYEAEKIASIRLVTKKPVEPSADEISRNSRSRSAKLRVVEKL